MDITISLFMYEDEKIRATAVRSIVREGVLSNKRIKCPTLGARSARFHIRLLTPDLKKSISCIQSSVVKR